MNLTATARSQIAKAKGALDGVFPHWGSALIDDGSSSLRARTAPQLRAFFGAVDLALESVSDAVTQAATLHGMTGTYTAEERQRRAAAVLEEGEAAYGRALASAAALVDRLAGDFRRTAIPPRPQPADATQEAALGNLRADLRMALDPLPGPEVPLALARLAGDAQAGGDPLAVWFIGASPWPGQYLRSRGLDGEAALFEVEVAQALAGGDSTDQQQARAGLAILEQGGDALRNLVAVVLPNLAHVAFEDARAMRPAHAEW